ncbi:MAG: dTDP-4-dehydrorhamnose reductase [Nitrospinota bacterium]|nr:dTDP-4-dehydrorhamnose reductase [Nitrospinota bacterium]
MKKVIVTGSSGGLGSELCRQIEDKWPGSSVPFDRSIADLSRADEIEKGLQDIGGEDLIIHSAAMTDVDGCEKDIESARKINVLSTQSIAEMAKKKGARLVFISSDYVFDGKKEAPYLEGDAPNPLNVYGRTKLEGERVTAQLDDSLIVRTSWLYGNTGKNFVKTMLALGEKGGPLKVVDDQVGAPTYYPDLAEAILKMVEKEVTGTVHISNSGSCSWYEFAKAIFEEKGMDVKVLPVPSSEFPRPAKRPANSRLDCGRYAGIAGKPLRDWRDALKEYLGV